MRNFLKTMLVLLGVIGAFTAAITLLIVSEHSGGTYISAVLSYILAHRPLQLAVMALLVIYGVLSILSIAFSGNVNSDAKSGVILPLKIGEVHISSQTFESIVTNVAKKYKGVKTAKVNVRLKDTGVGIDLYIYVLQDMVIADITEKLQGDIKDTILKQTTVTVESVSIRIKGIYTLNENKEV